MSDFYVDTGPAFITCGGKTYKINGSYWFNEHKRYTILNQPLRLGNTQLAIGNKLSYSNSILRQINIECSIKSDEEIELVNQLSTICRGIKNENEVSIWKDGYIYECYLNKIDLDYEKKIGVIELMNYNTVQVCSDD